MRHANRDAWGRHARRHGILPDRRERLVHALTWGGALIAVGGAAWMHGSSGWYPVAFWVDVLPALLAWSGLVRLLFGGCAGAVVSGLQRLALAAWFYVALHGLGGWTFGNTWPVALVIAGAGIVLRGLLEGPGRDELPAPAPHDGAAR